MEIANLVRQCWWPSHHLVHPQLKKADADVWFNQHKHGTCKVVWQSRQISSVLPYEWLIYADIYTGEVLAEELSLAANGKKASLQLSTAAKVCCSQKFEHEMMTHVCLSSGRAHTACYDHPWSWHRQRQDSHIRSTRRRQYSWRGHPEHPRISCEGQNATYHTWVRVCDLHAMDAHYINCKC